MPKLVYERYASDKGIVVKENETTVINIEERRGRDEFQAKNKPCKRENNRKNCLN
jgi:hypothetical protein